MALKSTIVAGKSVIFREFSVSDAITFMNIEPDDLDCLRHFLNSVIVSPTDIDVGDWDEGAVDVAVEVLAALNPQMFDGGSVDTPVTDVDISKAKTRKRAARVKFLRDVLILTEQGHPMLLTYPFSMYIVLLELNKKANR